MTRPRTPNPGRRFAWLAALGFSLPALGLSIALVVSLDRRRDVEAQKRAFERDRAAAALVDAVASEVDAVRERRGLPALAVIEAAGRFWPSSPGPESLRLRDGLVLPFELDTARAMSRDDVSMIEMPRFRDGQRAEQRGEFGAAALHYRRALAEIGDVERAHACRLVLARATLRSGDAKTALEVLGQFPEALPPTLALAVDSLRAEAHAADGSTAAANAAQARNRTRIERGDLGLGYLEYVEARRRYAGLDPPSALHAFYRGLVAARRRWTQDVDAVVVHRIEGVAHGLLLGGQVSDTIGGRAVRVFEVDGLVGRAVRRSRIDVDFVRARAAPRDFEVALPTLGTALRFRDREPIAGSIWQDRDARMMLGLGALALAVLAVAASVTLRAAAKQAHLSAMRADFISSVSHELKTPLTSIRLFADLLRDGRVDDPERIAQYHRLIGEEAEKLSHVVGNVLDASRIEAGRRAFVPEALDLSAIVRDAVASFAGRAQAENVLIDTGGVNGAVAIDADRDAVERVVSNLVDNALKYGAGPVQVATSGDGGGATLRVVDHGPGIPRGERRRLFRRFERGEHHGPGTPPGSGLGLALVTDILVAHGGELTVEDTPGGGATFIATFARKGDE